MQQQWSGWSDLNRLQGYILRGASNIVVIAAAATLQQLPGTDVAVYIDGIPVNMRPRERPVRATVARLNRGVVEATQNPLDGRDRPHFVGS